MASAEQSMESQRTTELTAFFESIQQEPDTDVSSGRGAPWCARSACPPAWCASC